MCFAWNVISQREKKYFFPIPAFRLNEWKCYKLKQQDWLMKNPRNSRSMKKSILKVMKNNLFFPLKKQQYFLNSFGISHSCSFIFNYFLDIWSHLVDPFINFPSHLAILHVCTWIWNFIVCKMDSGKMRFDLFFKKKSILSQQKSYLKINFVIW